ncbi:MAG: 30S ribosomal protein S7 [Rickettsiaceae bacterium]|jgi:small subunit ribosomal protein S7|nr:30S ribosomal protein S7 [Alphaproteobacteria bacterium]MBN8523273.1 30S ribosomal protein S7 [Rickettsiales bacterium]MCP5362818.1 30S ribosomal protein S7 [Rickettsiaceae bacterium]WPX99110.1 30S ribosomal protein S7 [Candidatus Megaera polyxenophila]MCP5374989.1 30S ribosomal protein S7 [Rickettsiaceae bacterium]
MSRRHAAVKKVIKPDTKYNSVLLSRFINNVMKDGKKSLAEKIVYGALERVEKKHNADPFKTFTDGINNVKPFVEVTSVRVGGANYQVPSPVDERRGYALATRWLINAAIKRSGRSMVEKLAEELFDAANNRGVAIKKREDTHKMAESNKAFAHFAQRTS